MTEPRNPSPILPVAVTALLLLGYFWSFSALSKPVFLWDGDRGCWVGVEYPPLDKVEFVEDRSAWASFFAPAEWLDRRIRPRRWSADFLNLLPDRPSRRR